MLDRTNFYVGPAARRSAQWIWAECAKRAMDVLLLVPGERLCLPWPARVLPDRGARWGQLTQTGCAGVVRQLGVFEALQGHLCAYPVLQLAPRCTADLRPIYIKYILPTLKPEAAKAISGLDW